MAAVASARAESMLLTVTAAPARASQRALSRPMPAPAPVTSALLPVRSMLIMCHHAGMTTVNPAEALGPLAQALAADGYELNVELTQEHAVRLDVRATESACEECLVPKELF